jgi:hypothetical protein
MPIEFNCYHCGQPGHIKSECPSRRGGASPPAPPAESGVPEHPAAKPVPAPVPIWDRALYEDRAPWAEWVREQMGWSHDAREQRLRKLAAEQVAEFRAGPAYPGNMPAHMHEPIAPRIPED